MVEVRRLVAGSLRAVQVADGWKEAIACDERKA